MSKFNTNAVDTSHTVNLAGGNAYTLDDKTALYVTASTSLGGGAGDKFYVSANAEYTNIVTLVNKIAKQDPAFVFQLAAYLRNEMHLRSIPMILFVEGIRAMHANKSKSAAYPIDVTLMASKVFGRPDEITEAVAYWLHVNKGNHKLPMNLRSSLEIAFNKFNEYSMVKYDQDNKKVKLKDVLRLVHPKPKDAVQAALFNYILRGVAEEGAIVESGHRAPLTNLAFKSLLPMTAARDALMKMTKFDAKAKELVRESNATWETVISKFGSTEETWSYVLPNMGYMAVLRNLNNFLKNDISMDDVVTKLTSKEEVLKSKQLPFRFLSAMKAIEGEEYALRYYSYADSNRDMFAKWNQPAKGDSKALLRQALSIALNHSVSNIPKFTGRTLVAADVSGSMDSRLNDKSSVTMKEIATVMAAMASHLSEDGIASAFGTTFDTVTPSANILDTANAIGNLVGKVGMSTNAWTILDYLINNRIVTNRVMYFTDTQCYNSYGYGQSLNELWKKYATWVQGTTNGETTPYLYEINLTGGNTSNFDRESRVAQIGGWSEKIFDLMASYEGDPRSAVKKIAELYPVLTR